MPYQNTTPSSRRYIGPTARDLADRLPGSRREGPGFRLRGWCHDHGHVVDSASLAIRDSTQPEGGITVKCWAGCARKDIIAALEQATGFPIWDAWESNGPARSTGRSSPAEQAQTHPPVPAPSTPPALRQPSGIGNSSSGQPVDLQAIAQRTWAQDSQPIPLNPQHPARLWLAVRNLWRPELPLPGAIRWLPAAAHYQGRGSHTGAGSIIALGAPPAAWMIAWPALPAPQAVQIAAVDAEGSPALDRPKEAGGLGKRSIGSTNGAIVVLGCPELVNDLEPVRVAEGVADALALASHYPGTAIACLGTSTMRDTHLAAWLATAAAGVVVHADADQAPQGGSPPGEAAARALCRAIEDTGGRAQAVMPAAGKDPADAAMAAPFGELDPDWLDYARTLRETTGWPRWEIARQATTILHQETTHDPSR